MIQIIETPDTGEMYDREALNEELDKVEKPAGIANPKDFRHEVVNFFLRYKANNNGEAPRWTSYNKIKTVIEKKIIFKYRRFTTSYFIWK